MGNPYPPGEGQTKHTLEQVLTAIDVGCTKAGTARALGCSRQTVVAYARRWKTVADAFEDKRAELCDLAENGLRKALENQEAWAIAFTLRTLGKNEGYTERTEIAGANGEPLRIVVEYADDPATATEAA